MKIQSSLITYKNSKSVSLSRVYCVKSVPPKLGVRTCIGCTCLWRDRLHWPSERELPQFRQFRRLQKLCLSLKISCLLHPPPLPPSPHTHLGNILGSERVRQAGGGRGLNRFSLCDKMLFDEIVCVNQDKILRPDHS